MCAIANRGWLMRPMLVDRLEDSAHSVVAKYSPQPVRQVITETTARLTQAFYLQYLGRPADSFGLQANASALSTGATEEAVINGLVVSPEFYDRPLIASRRQTWWQLAKVCTFAVIGIILVMFIRRELFSFSRLYRRVVSSRR